MTATTHERDPLSAGDYPVQGTYEVAENTLLLKGTQVCRDAAGRLVPAVDGEGLNVIGFMKANADNRTTAPEGGGAGAINGEVKFGLASYLVSGDSTPIPGQVMFAVDNQTVSTDSDSGQRGISGYCTRYADSLCEVLQGPHIVGQIVIAADVAAYVTAAQEDIAALEVDAATANAVWPIPLTSFVAADATPLAKFASADDTTFGLDIADSEALCIRWNNHATPAAALCEVPLPVDLDDAADVILEILASKSGATVGDATTFLVAAYFIAAGDLHDAGTNCGGTTDALEEDATAKTTDLLTLTFAAADVPAGAVSLTLTLKPTDGTLGADDVMVHAVRLRYTRKAQTA